MERLGLKTPSKLKNKSRIGWTRRRKMAGYRDVLDSPTSTSSAINQLFEHHDENVQIQVMEDNTTNKCSFESTDIESISDNENSFQATKDAPGFVSSRGLIFCLDDTRCDTITHTVSPDFRSEMGTNVRNMNITHQSKVEKESTRETAEHDEIELISNCHSSTTTTSLPPPGFCLPRREIRDAIMYHEELGKALSKLALDPVMQCTDENGGTSSAASTTSTAESTLDTTLDSSNSRCRVDALRIDSRRPTRQNFTIGFDERMEQVSCSESFSSKSEFSSGSNQRSRLKQHITFLENHAMKQFPSTTISQSYTTCEDKISSVKNYNSTASCESFDDCFFPRADDLQSLPPSASSCDVSKCNSSPPNTPKFNVLSDDHQLWLGNTGHERNDDLRVIKDEIAHIISDYVDKTRSDISSTFDTQLEKHLSKLKSDVFHLSERLDKSAQTSIQTEHSQGNIGNHASPFGETSRIPRSGNFMGGGSLPNEFEKALSSMETKIINTITSEIRANAMQQRHVIEEIVQEKISVAIAGSNLRLISDIQQIVKQKEIGRASVMSMGNKASPPTSSLRIGSLRKHIRGPQSVGAGTKTRSNMNDNSCITSTNSEDITQKSLEDSFSETIQAIDQFVADCDEIASDFDRIALRMECNHDEYNDPECDTEEFDVLIGTASGFVMF